MKVLRLFGILHSDHRYLFVEKKNQTESRYKKRPISKDFPIKTTLEEAEIWMHEEHGAPPEIVSYKYPPSGFVRITHSAVVEDTPERGVIETFRATEMDLLSPADLKNAQGEKPKRK